MRRALCGCRRLAVVLAHANQVASAVLLVTPARVGADVRGCGGWQHACRGRPSGSHEQQASRIRAHRCHVSADDGALLLNLGDPYTTGNRGWRAPDRKESCAGDESSPTWGRGENNSRSVPMANNCSHWRWGPTVEQQQMGSPLLRLRSHIVLVFAKIRVK